MKKVVLQPIRHKDEYTRAIEEQILAHFREVIFAPLLDLLGEHNVTTRDNATGSSAVVKALEDGRLWYGEGEFIGQMNAEISRELREAGATFNADRGTFQIEPTQLPFAIRHAAAVSMVNAENLYDSVIALLGVMQTNAAQAPVALELKFPIHQIVADLGEQYNDTITGYDMIEITAETTGTLADQLGRELTTNLDLYVKDFTNEEILTLRTMAQQNAFAGYRTDRLADMIEGRFGVTKRKAAFLADQETGMLVSKYREIQYRAAGSRSYKWSTSHDERVRKDHRALNQQTFMWDSPPVTNLATGDRNHPGNDFRCRCVAMPIIEIAD